MTTRTGISVVRLMENICQKIVSRSESESESESVPVPVMILSSSR